MLALIAIYPSVFASGQYPETVSQAVSYPAKTLIGTDGSARFNVTIQVTYSGFKHGYDTLNIILAYDYLGSFADMPAGNAHSSPNQCNSTSSLGTTDCNITPKNSSGIETVTFNVVIPSAKNQQYSFASWVIVQDSFYATQGGIVAGGKSLFDVTVSN